MPLGQGILGVFDAIQQRIEMTGQAPTWRVTGPSFDAAWTFAQEAIADPAVLHRQDRRRWWPRVTLTVTNDPAVAATAPALDELRNPPRVPAQREPRQVALWNDEEYAESFSPLEEIFAHQEELRAARREVPRQRSRRTSRRTGG
jgi:hypothetical protein